jgi:hypothetical protein
MPSSSTVKSDATITPRQYARFVSSGLPVLMQPKHREPAAIFEQVATH